MNLDTAKMSYGEFWTLAWLWLWARVAVRSGSFKAVNVSAHKAELPTSSSRTWDLGYLKPNKHHDEIFRQNALKSSKFVFF
jgi:hypothetical protein